MDTLLRQIPKVDDLLRLPALKMLTAEAGTSAVTEAVRRTLDRLRADILVGTVTELPSTEALCAQISASCRASRLPLPPGRYQCHRDRSAHQSGPGLPE